MNVGSLFSGADGLCLGLERAGMHVVFGAEKDRHARAVFRYHHPDIPCYSDVREVTSERLHSDGIGVPDVVAGGFPCTDISRAGNRAGLAGEHSGLWFEFARVVADLLPRWVIVENVPDLLSSNDGRDMGTIVGTLGDLGYGWASRVLDARWAGVAQRRRRLFIVASLGTDRAVQVLLEPEGVPGHPPTRRETRPSVAAPVGVGVGASGGGHD